MNSSDAKEGEDGRVVVHFDLDAFYVACERELNHRLLSVPTAVSQYNPYGTLETKTSSEIAKRLVACPRVCGDGDGSNVATFARDDCALLNAATARPEHQHSQQHKYHPDANGCLIAVSYEARACGVKRNDRGRDSIRNCPDLHIVQVPVKHGKADLTMYRNASKRVMDCLSSAIQDEVTKDEQILVEVASIDEVYVDVSIPAKHMAEQILNSPTGMRGASASSSTDWDEIVATASQCTTIGGVEILSKAAQATNALNKDEIRRGSQHQVLDSSSIAVDGGSKSWWCRPLYKWSMLEIRLACGAYLAAKARLRVQKSFDNGVFTLSAGVSSNKLLAKLASGLKKPNRQTLVNRLDRHSLQTLFHPLPLGRIRGLGGKFGDRVGKLLNIETVGQLAETSLPTLRSALAREETTGNNPIGDNQKLADFLFDISRGICREAVTPRDKPKSIGCSKTFFGPLAIPVSNHSMVEKWVRKLCEELVERLQLDQDEHDRQATTLIAVVRLQSGTTKKTQSKQCRAPRTLSEYSRVALDLVHQLVDAFSESKKDVEILILGFSGAQFTDRPPGTKSIASAFEVVPSASSTATYNTRDSMQHLMDNKRKNRGIGKWLTSSPGERIATATSNCHQLERSAKRTKINNITERGLSPSRDRHAVESSPNRSPAVMSSAMAMPTIAELDPAVLAELPEDIKKSILMDIQRQRKPLIKQKTSKIHSYFQAKSS